MVFNQLQLNNKILIALEKANFNKATEIQAKAIPLFLENKNIFGKSSTGTGKTASFVLPILQNVDPFKRKVQAIILAPTRELALQIVNQIRLFGSRIENLVTASLIGGASLSDQIKRLKQSQIVVGTPGRINDHLNRNSLRLDEVKTVIFDEADEMLKMGFKNEIDALFEKLSPKVQVGLFSATTSEKVMQIANNYMNEYEVIEIKNQIEVNANIENTFIFTKGYDKSDLLVKVFEKHKPKRVIIFSNTKRQTDKISDGLKKSGIKSVVINGDKRQSQRTRAINQFRNNEIPVLVATDVVARGIDISGVDFVINFDVSIENEHFVHRIGRTGRNNSKGQSITFVQSQNVLKQMRCIEKEYKLIINEMQISEYGKFEKDSNNNNVNFNRSNSNNRDKKNSNRANKSEDRFFSKFDSKKSNDRRKKTSESFDSKNRRTKSNFNSNSKIGSSQRTSSLENQIDYSNNKNQSRSKTNNKSNNQKNTKSGEWIRSSSKTNKRKSDNKKSPNNYSTRSF